MIFLTNRGGASFVNAAEAGTECRKEGKASARRNSGYPESGLRERGRPLPASPSKALRTVAPDARSGVMALRASLFQGSGGPEGSITGLPDYRITGLPDCRIAGPKHSAYHATSPDIPHAQHLPPEAP